MAAAREGLDLLGHPGVLRNNPGEASALVALTVAVEQPYPFTPWNTSALTTRPSAPKARFSETRFRRPSISDV